MQKEKIAKKNYPPKKTYLPAPELAAATRHRVGSVAPLLDLPRPSLTHRAATRSIAPELAAAAAPTVITEVIVATGEGGGRQIGSGEGHGGGGAAPGASSLTTPRRLPGASSSATPGRSGGGDARSRCLLLGRTAHVRERRKRKRGRGEKE
jgi:hypothetical protein